MQSEIRAKQQLLEELKKIRSAYLATKQRLDEADKKVSVICGVRDKDDIEKLDVGFEIEDDMTWVMHMEHRRV